MISFFNAVNTYTDASIVKDEFNNFITCAGYITVFHNEILSYGTRVVYSATNNYGEILAIYMGIQNLLSYKEHDTFLNLFSDSMISVNGLKTWVYNWLRSMDPTTKMLINSNGNTVANQEIYCNIINYIVQNNTHINLYHQRGHLNPSNVKHMELIKQTFVETNNTDITDDIIREICYYNDMVDNMTRDILTKEVNGPFNPLLYKKPVIVSRVLNWDVLKKYRSLIGG